MTEARHADEKSVGYELLAPEETSAVTPGIDSGAVPENAVFNPGEGWVSLPDLVDFLLEEFHARGGELVLNAGRAAVTVDGGRPTGVETAAGATYEADAVLSPWTTTGMKGPSLSKRMARSASRMRWSRNWPTRHPSSSPAIRNSCVRDRPRRNEARGSSKGKRNPRDMT